VVFQQSLDHVDHLEALFCFKKHHFYNAYYNKTVLAYTI